MVCTLPAAVMVYVPGWIEVSVMGRALCPLDGVGSGVGVGIQQ